MVIHDLHHSGLQTELFDSGITEKAWQSAMIQEDKVGITDLERGSPCIL